jgi:hypothetical protein
MKADINLVEVHPQLSYNIHSVDGVLVGASSLWAPGRLGTMYLKKKLVQIKIPLDSSFFALGPHFNKSGGRRGVGWRGGGKAMVQETSKSIKIY